MRRGLVDMKPNLDPPVSPIEYTARHALEKSCYLTINWRINENALVEQAVKTMAANGIGCLAVTSGTGEQEEVVGMFSERDYLSKVALLKRDPKQTKVLQACTYGKANLVSVTLDNPVDACMQKMLGRDIRHLLIRQKQTGKIVGMLSVKDLVKCVVEKHDAVVDKLSNIVASEMNL